MEKYIDKEQYEEIQNTLFNNGISPDLFELAGNMDFDLVNVFNNKIINTKEKQKNENINIVSRNILGIYGNYITYVYYKGLGYDVTLEYPIYDKNGNVTTKADLAFYDKDKKLNLCEVKTAYQIIGSKEGYNKYLPKNDEKEEKFDILKYMGIGKKLLTQVGKLKTKADKVNVVVFNNCNIDSEMKNNLNEMGINLNVISMDVYQLFDYIKQMVTNIYDIYHRKENVKTKVLA